MTTAPRRTVPLLILLSVAAAPTVSARAADAALVGEAGTSPSVTVPAGDAFTQQRIQLPQTAARAQRSALAFGETSTWLVGTHSATDRLPALAKRFGGKAYPELGTLRVPASKAREASRALGTALDWASPNPVAKRSSSFDDPGGILSPWARTAAAAPSLTPPLRSLATIGIVDDPVFTTVSELAGVNSVNDRKPKDPHGTMVASTAAAPYDAAGVVGVAPGAEVLSFGTSLDCDDVAQGVIQVIRRGARVVNLSIGFDAPCFPLYRATAYAYVKNATVVVASGNDADRGNPLSFPAVYPHVVTAGAITPTFTTAAFSNYNDWVDIAAPGVDVPVDIPIALDKDDGVRDGRTIVSGTSFSAPFVSGGISWILGARPKLDPGQVADILRMSAKELETPGWDPYTGFGQLQVSAALNTPRIAADPFEPNDDPAVIKKSGVYRQPTVWTGAQARFINATGDSADDAIDAYRVRIPAGKRMRAKVTPTEGYVNLFAFPADVDQFVDRSPTESSTEGGTAIDSFAIRNRSSKAQEYFIVVNTVPPSSTRAQSRYTLKLYR